MPSRVEEAFGLVAAEAAMRGIPVVVSERGALPEIVVDGETGFVVAAEDPNALADRIEVLIDNPGLRRNFGLAAKARARAEFSAERMIVEIEAICANAQRASKEASTLGDVKAQPKSSEAVTASR